MATVIMQRWDGLTPEQYDRLREVVGWDRDIPAGMTFHVASFGDDTLRMTDVWDLARSRCAAPQEPGLSPGDHPPAARTSPAAPCMDQPPRITTGPTVVAGRPTRARDRPLRPGTCHSPNRP